MDTTPASLQQRDAARRRLESRQAELRRLLQEAAGAAVHAADQPADVSDFKELAGHETQEALSDTTTAQAVRELAAIDAALRRIREGGYGLCEDCGEAIAPARLAAVPATTVCAACQGLRERAGAQHA